MPTISHEDRLDARISPRGPTKRLWRPVFHATREPPTSAEVPVDRPDLEPHRPSRARKPRSDSVLGDEKMGLGLPPGPRMGLETGAAGSYTGERVEDGGMFARSPCVRS